MGNATSHRRAVVLREPFAEHKSSVLWPVRDNPLALENLLGRCVTHVQAPFDDFFPATSVKFLGELQMGNLINRPPAMSFRRFTSTVTEAEVGARIEGMLSAYFQREGQQSLRVESQKTQVIRLVQLEEALTMLDKMEAWHDAVARKAGEHKVLYWVVGLTILERATIEYKKEMSSAIDCFLSALTFGLYALCAGKREVAETRVSDYPGRVLFIVEYVKLRFGKVAGENGSAKIHAQMFTVAHEVGRPSLVDEANVSAKIHAQLVSVANEVGSPSLVDEANGSAKIHSQLVSVANEVGSPSLVDEALDERDLGGDGGTVFEMKGVQG